MGVDGGGLAKKVTNPGGDLRAGAGARHRATHGHWSTFHGSKVTSALCDTPGIGVTYNTTISFFAL